jgi:maltose-binding protein MalE
VRQGVSPFSNVTPPIPDFGGPSSSKRKLAPILLALALLLTNLSAWTNGELLIWMDNDRAKGLAPVAQKFQDDFGLKITIDTPGKITDTFPMAAQAGKGPDVVVWARDKVGEWADAGLIRQSNAKHPSDGSFFSALGTALQIATDGHASQEAAAREAEAIMRER